MFVPYINSTITPLVYHEDADVPFVLDPAQGGFPAIPSPAYRDFVGIRRAEAAAAPIQRSACRRSTEGLGQPWASRSVHAPERRIPVASDRIGLQQTAPWMRACRHLGTDLLNPYRDRRVAAAGHTPNTVW
jgi:hypothetical protein